PHARGHRSLYAPSRCGDPSRRDLRDSYRIRAMTNWQDSPLTLALGLRVPIIQGPFGGGLSSPALAAAVSNLGGLGSYGAQGHSPQHIEDAVAAIRERTAAPFAMNLWVSTEDPGA